MFTFEVYIGTWSTRSAEQERPKKFREAPTLYRRESCQLDRVRKQGCLEETRKIAGYHDEPLKGDRKGQRSIRLSRAYRAIYVIKSNEIEFVEIQEVNKHAY